MAIETITITTYYKNRIFMTLKPLVIPLLTVFVLGIASVCFADNDETIFSKQTISPIYWQPCYSLDNANLQCATYAVPLDYQARKHSSDAVKTIDVALIKLPAANSAKKPLGSLFVNPGGPGASGIDLIRNVGPFLFTQEVRDNYDLISFDPRGIHLSSPATCGISSEQAADYLPSVDFPTNNDQIIERINKNRNFGMVCRQQGSAIMQHMSTADVAKDMDILRQAVGDSVLNYVGYSYGSYLGVTYANLFPQKVGRFIVDGVLDPIQWSTGRGFSGWLVPMTQRLGSDKGSFATLNEFFRLCDLAGANNCHFAGDAAKRFEALANAIKQNSLSVLAEDGSMITVDTSFFVNAVKSALYNTSNWQSLADLLAYAEAQAPPVLLGEGFSKIFTFFSESQSVQIPFDNDNVGTNSVLCSDSNNPKDPWIWPLAAAAADLENGYFGASWSWPSSICTEWPTNQKNRFAGPFNQRTRNPILISNTLFDPATPYSGALAVRKLLPNSRLLTVAGWGHLTPGLSGCADAITANYLMRGELPKEDTTCLQESLPFDLADNVDVFAGMPRAIEPTAKIPDVIRLDLLKRKHRNEEQNQVRQAILHKAVSHGHR